MKIFFKKELYFMAYHTIIKYVANKRDKKIATNNKYENLRRKHNEHKH